MEIELSRLTLFAPDEMTSHWFISRDFASDFGPPSLSHLHGKIANHGAVTGIIAA